LKLHFSRNPNPRLAVAAARYLDADVQYEFAAPLAPGQADRYRVLNPNLRVPILEESGVGLWEADAIACRLSRYAGSEFWRTGADEPAMIQWISWAKANFMRAGDMVHFERGTKQRYNLGPLDPLNVAAGLELFAVSAGILNDHLEGRDWLTGASVSYADFRMATFLPYNDAARLPIDDYPAVVRWYGRLMQIDAWRDPFAGLESRPLPPAPRVD
jgi:glutathione S-transferase